MDGNGCYWMTVRYAGEISTIGSPMKKFLIAATVPVDEGLDAHYLCKMEGCLVFAIS
jgi:hypothetical protein